MSFYRRFKDGRVERHNSETGEFIPCEADEPFTRVRKPNEGMIVAPAESLIEVKGAFTIEWIKYDG